MISQTHSKTYLENGTSVSKVHNVRRKPDQADHGGCKGGLGIEQRASDGKVVVSAGDYMSSDYFDDDIGNFMVSAISIELPCSFRDHDYDDAVCGPACYLVNISHTFNENSDTESTASHIVPDLILEFWNTITKEFDNNDAFQSEWMI